MAIADPPLNFDQIQGNILAGFNKPFQTFLFLRIKPGNTELARARRWLKHTLAPQVSYTRAVIDHNRAYRAARAAGTTLPPVTWINVAISAPGVRRIRPVSELNSFSDEAFKLGLAARSEFLGDPTDPVALGNKRNWLYGGTADTEADIVVIVASDTRELRDATVSSLVSALDASGLQSIVEPQQGQDLPPPWDGHEHFGFKDGVSQPGVRGVGGNGPTDLVTERYFASTDRRHDHFGKPGQPLLWPGEFIVGQKRQAKVDIDSRFVIDSQGVREPADPSTAFPSWAQNGSYLVIRRLRQDYGAFWGFVYQQARELDLPPERFASMLVGRWKSGAPLMRAPAADNPALAADGFANNHFAYNSDSRATQLDTSQLPADYPGDNFPLARGDFLGTVCPHFAHIRKVNPRDGATDLGVAEDTSTRAILRRGIPYGESLLGVAHPTPQQLAQDRGLIFACYQTSIVDQFETLIRRWTNRPNLPTPGGHDAIIGQAHSHEAGRRRFIDMPGGPRCFIDSEWVIPTGGGYFFAPSRQALLDTLGAD